MRKGDLDEAHAIIKWLFFASLLWIILFVSLSILKRHQENAGNPGSRIENLLQ
jgi:hypothetical protein